MKNKYANRGMGLEKEIEDACDQYRTLGIADIRKRPTPIKVASTKRGMVSGFFEKKSTVDFDGFYFDDGAFFAMEAKEVKVKRFPLKNISHSQLEYLEDVANSKNGQAWIYVRFNIEGKIEDYSMEFKKFHTFILLNPSKKSIPLQYFRNNIHKIEPSKDGVILNFLW